MAGVEQNILVKIKVLLEGLENVRAFAGHVKDLGGGGNVAALTGNIDKLSAAVDKLASAQEKSSKKGGFAKFLTETAAVVSILGGLPRAFEGVGKLLDLADGIKGKVGLAFEKVSGLFTRAGAAAKQGLSSVGSSLTEIASGAGEQAGAVLSEIGGSLAALGPIALAVVAALAALLAIVAAVAVGFVGLGVGVGVGAVALVGIAKQGLEAHRQLEQVQLGIAAIITSLGQVKVGGLPVEGAEKFAVATRLAADQVAKLRVDAINTTATFEQIAPAFQAAIAPGLAAGLSLDQVREITVKVVQAAGALGIPFDQVNQEVRAILEGTINEDARLAKVLGISNKMVASWKSQGTLAEELNKRLEGFAVAGVAAADTLDGLTSNLQEALNVFSSEATSRAFDALKEEFRKLLPQLFDFKNAGIQAQFKSLTGLADDVLVRVVQIAGASAQDIVAGIKRAGEFVSQNRAIIDQILNLCVGVVGQLIEIGRVIVGVATDADTWRAALELVREVLLLINVVLALIAAQLRDVAPLLKLLVLASTVAASGFGVGLSSSGGTRQQGFARVRLKPDGGLADDPTVTGPKGAAAAGKKGGGGEKSKVPELQRTLDRATVETELARAQARFEALRQEINATVDSIKSGLDDATLSIANAYRLEALLADKALKNEQDRIDAELTAAQKRHDLAIKDLDPKLKGKERSLAVAAEDEKLVAETVKLEAERKRIVEETKDKKAALVREEARDQQALENTVADIENQLDAMSRSGSVRADAAAREIETRFRETRRQMVANFGEASEQVKRLDELINHLSQRAKFQELSDGVSTQLDELHDLEELLTIGVEQGSIKAQDAAKRRLELERELKRSLVDEIAGLAEIARRTGDPALIEAVRRLQLEWAKLGQHVNETAKKIDDALRSGLEDTLVDIVTRAKSVGDAFRDLARTILAEIARIVAANLINKIFGGTLNTAGGNSIGNIIARAIGLGTPKASNNPQAPGRGIENLPLVIKNLDSSTGGKLDGVKGNTAQTVNELRGGFGIVAQGFNELLSFLPNLLPAQPSVWRSLLMAGIQFAGSLAQGALKGGGSGEGGRESVTSGVVDEDTGAYTRPRRVGHAEGGPINGPGTGTSDSILSWLSNGEFVIKAASVQRVGASVLEHINRLGEIPGFNMGGFVGAIQAAGLPDRPSRDDLSGTEINQHFHHTYQVQGGRLTPQAQAAIERDAARATRRGAQRSVASHK